MQREKRRKNQRSFSGGTKTEFEVKGYELGYLNCTMYSFANWYTVLAVCYLHVISYLFSVNFLFIVFMVFLLISRIFRKIVISI